VPERSDFAALLTVSAAIVGADQFSKALVTASLGGPGVARLNVFGPWLSLEYAENRGAAFGLFPGMAPLLAVGSVLVLGVLLVHFMRTDAPPLWQTVALGAILGGATGNLLDRIRLGYVVDFVSIGPWPNFNVADSAITLGVLVLIWAWAKGGDGAASRNPIDRHA
jgi:signal peptidase II